MLLLTQLGLSIVLVVVTAVMHGLGPLTIGRSLRAVDRGAIEAELDPLS